MRRALIDQISAISESDPSDTLNLTHDTGTIVKFDSLNRLTCSEGRGNICDLKKEAPSGEITLWHRPMMKYVSGAYAKCKLN